MIKNYFKVFALILGFAFIATSCDDEEEYLQVAGNKFETTYLKAELTGGMTATFEYKTKEELQRINAYWVFEFTTDGKVLMEEGQIGTFTQADDVITMSDGEEITVFNLDGDQLTMTETGDDTIEGIDVTFKNTFVFTKM